MVRREDDADEFIREKCKKYKIDDIEILELDHTTDGQVTTCMFAIACCNSDDAVIVYNIDTYIEPYELECRDISGDGHIPCFHGQGDHWSFVKIDENGKAIEVREKKRISDDRTLGAYFFVSKIV